MSGDTQPDEADRLAVRAAVAGLPERQRAALLLRDAVPVEEIEPDIDAVVGRVRSRRRRRTLTRVAASLVVVVGIGGSAALVAGRGPDAPQVEIVDPADSAADGGGVDATEFTRLLASRPWVHELYGAGAWPVQPGEMVEGRDPPPQAVVVGVLQQVRSDDDGRPICMYAGGCFSLPGVETTIAVERVLAGDIDPSVPLPVHRGLDVEGPQDGISEPNSGPSEPSGWMFEAAAPAGARMLMLLQQDPETGAWLPVEPAGIVVEDPDGVAIPQADPDAPDLDMSFDDYVSEVERLLAED